MAWKYLSAITIAIGLCGPLSAVTNSAQAGDRVFNFGGPLGTFKATRNPPGTSSQHRSNYRAHSAKKARAKTAAKRKAAARRHARANAKAEAKAKAIAGRKAELRRKKIAEQKALAARKARQRRRLAAAEAIRVKKAKAAAEKTEGTFVDAPSTTTLLTEGDISAESDAAPVENNAKPRLDEVQNATGEEPAGTTGANEPLVQATSDTVNKAIQPGDSAAASDKDTENGDSTGCKRYVPAVGLTISIAC